MIILGLAGLASYSSEVRASPADLFSYVLFPSIAKINTICVVINLIFGEIFFLWCPVFSLLFVIRTIVLL